MLDLLFWFLIFMQYHGSYLLHHWLQLSDWLPTLEATLALDEEQLRRVGDDSVGGPAVTRQLRLIRILMRDLLIGVSTKFNSFDLMQSFTCWYGINSIFYFLQVNYLHSHGLAHTELRLKNVHVSPIDKHVKVSSLCFCKLLYSVLAIMLNSLLWTLMTC
jgi:serine/threonine protein kinase